MPNVSKLTRFRLASHAVAAADSVKAPCHIEAVNLGIATEAAATLRRSMKKLPAFNSGKPNWIGENGAN